jgi:hypothetical protein
MEVFKMTGKKNQGDAKVEQRWGPSSLVNQSINRIVNIYKIEIAFIQ